MQDRLSTRVLLAGLIAALVVAACGTSPLGRRQLKLVSDEQVTQMGVATYRELQKKEPATRDSRQSGYVQCVANLITREVPGMNWNVPIPSSWEVTTFQSDDVNAFALPGGKIGVYTGLLKIAENQDQLAAVVGHEVAHVLAGHSNERVSSSMAGELGTMAASAVTGISPEVLGLATQTLLLLPYSRAHETEADLLGLDLMAKAGFDPRQSINLWQNMGRASGGQKPPEMLSTHPSDQTRIGNLSGRLSVALPLYEQAKAQGKRPRCG
ncbi:MAG TPA: M48 family metallopeptidase [Nevskiaceae bacterium]|nr:M48 family metallopeptidase [Nevskiaceae bacterium]